MAEGKKGHRLLFPSIPVRTLMISLGAVPAAFLIGGMILWATGSDPLIAFTALFKGAFGSRPALLRTLEKSTPLIFNGLAISLAFQAGLFNIGAQGQFLCGAFAAAVCGVYLPGQDPFLLISLSLIAGVAAGAVYGIIQGGLKAWSGAHEVITGIMFNYIAINLTDYLVTRPFRDPTPGNVIARTSRIQATGRLPDVLGMPGGFWLALLAAFLVWWLLRRTVIGFAITTVGTGSHAARYAGMRVSWIVVGTMGISAALAGIGGGVETLGVVHRFQPGFNTGIGFEGITIALLGGLHPLGVLPAAILIGAMKAGAGMMQFAADVDREMLDVIQALLLLFVAAEAVFQRLGKSSLKTIHLPRSTGWKGTG